MTNEADAALFAVTASFFVYSVKSAENYNYCLQK